jgi:CHAT domain-containing protein
VPDVVASDASANDLALQLIDGDEGLSANLVGGDALALGWALKDLCYSAWSCEPQRAAKAADALGTLSRESCAGASRATRQELKALAHWTAGIAHITRGQMSDAVQCFDAADELFRTISRPDRAAQTQVPKIMALSMLGRNDDAIACAERAQREFIALGDARAAGKVGLNLGALHVRRGAFAEAARHSREATVFFARAGDYEHSVMADINLADALTSLGDFDEAMRIFARARMRADARGFPVLRALVDESVGLLQLARGNYRDALTGFEGSRRQYEQMEMPQHLAIAEKQLADAYLELRLLPEALTLFDQAMVHFERLDMPDEQAWTLAQRGRVQALLADPANAAESFERSASLFAAQDNGVGEAAVALARAELALANSDFVMALAWSRQAAQGFRVAGLADGRFRADLVEAHAHLISGRIDTAKQLFESTLMQARSLQLLTLEVRCLTGLGLTAQAAGNAVAAHASFSSAVQQFEDQRRALPWDDLRSAFLSDHLRPYQELLRLSLDAHQADATPERATEVLLALDRFRARSLGERLAQEARIEDDPSTDALRDRLNWLYRRARRMEDDGESSSALIDEARRTERELLERGRRARLAAPSPQVNQANDESFDVASLQQALGEHDALVEYGVLDDELFACVVTCAGVTLHRRMATWSQVVEALRSARFQIETLRFGAAPVEQHLASLTARAQLRMSSLYSLVWAPLGDALSAAGRVIVVPHAQLGSLPFAALLDGDEAVGQRYELAVAPSARLALRGLVRPMRQPRSAVALAESSRLPQAAVEARFVSALFADSQALIDEKATLATLSGSIAGADVVHFACHAEFRGDSPMFSALHLHDGPLTVEAAERLDLQPGIIVLSACETGLADVGNGDEMVGLVRAFLIAGAARVLASLWPVGDKITLLFMTSFYGALRDGQEPAEALRIAQADVRRDHPHPFHWAAFVLHGGW